MESDRVFSSTKLIAVILTALAAVLLNLLDPTMALIAAGAAIVVVILAKEPLYGLLTVIIILPFSGTELLNLQLLGIPGLKLFNLLAAGVLFFFLVYKKPEFSETSDKSFIVGLIFIFVIAVGRSVSYIERNYSIFWEDTYSISKYFLSHLLKPLLVFLPFILIVYYVRNKRDINRVINCVAVAVMALSVFILFLYVFQTPDRSDFEVVRMGFGAVLGMHGNNLADIYIASYPLILAGTFAKKNVFMIITLLLSLVTIGILYSRSAYFTVLICTMLFLLVSGNFLWLLGISIAGGLGYTIIPQSIIERATTGWETPNINVVSAGRTSDIWMPLLDEYLGQPLKMLFGSGRYGIMSTDAFNEGHILPVSHAHNMYLDMIMDSGIVGLAFFLVFFGIMFYRFVDSHRYIKSKAWLYSMYGVEISMAAFMIRGITDSFLFPALTNSYLWIILAIGLSIVYAHKKDNYMENNRVFALKKG